MNAPYSKIFLAIQERILTQVTAIKSIDLNIGQLKFHVRPPISFPGVLIDFDRFKFDDWGQNMQKGEGTVQITLVYAPFDESSDQAPDAIKQAALEFYETEWALNQALHGWNPDTNQSGYLSRRANATNDLRPDLRIRVLTYALEFEDYSTQDTETTAAATPAFTYTKAS